MGNVYKDGREYFKVIDWHFYREKAILEAVAEARSDSARPQYVNKNGLPDPTAYEAIRNATPLSAVRLATGDLVKLPEKWLEVMSRTYAWAKKVGDGRYEVARRRYKGEPYLVSCYALAISQSNYSLTLERFRNYAALQAVQAGLITV